MDTVLLYIPLGIAARRGNNIHSLSALVKGIGPDHRLLIGNGDGAQMFTEAEGPEQDQFDTFGADHRFQMLQPGKRLIADDPDTLGDGDMGLFSGVLKQHVPQNDKPLFIGQGITACKDQTADLEQTLREKDLFEAPAVEKRAIMELPDIRKVDPFQTNAVAKGVLAHKA